MKGRKPIMINGIEQLCKFAFNFLNMNTTFIYDTSTIGLEYVLTKIPDPLRAYFSNTIDRLKLNESSSEYNVLFHSNSYRLNYISAKIYDGSSYLGSIVVGPYLLEEPTILMVESVISDNKMAMSLKNIVKQYYLSLPMVSTYTAKIIAEFLSYMISNFNSSGFDNQKIGSLTYDFKTEHSVSSDAVKQNTEQYAKFLEERYRFENDMLHAVELGDKELLESIVRKSTSFISNTPDRVPNDPLRSGKNYSIVLNTLLRKAAEKGGLHYIYLDSISSKYAVQIEKCATLQQLSDLNDAMKTEYCDSVKKLSLKNYSSIVRKAIEFIRMNLNQNLSLNSISEVIHMSPSELSRQFKKETGENITEYINKRRINEATYILENKNISITDAGFMVGYNDVNYFAKVFKKIKGVTPSEYRKSKG